MRRARALIPKEDRRVLLRYFRLKIEGLAHVPAQGAALLVRNHNGGLLPTDGFFTTSAIHDHFGVERAVYALAHDFMLGFQRQP